MVKLPTIAKNTTIDPAKLVDSRLLVCANSGGGKSYLLRVIAELLSPTIQVVILDSEGEFASLRERVDAVLVGPDGEVEAHPKSAALLARKLAELGTHAIIDIYELKKSERRRYVKIFLDALISVPKRWWHPMLVIVDEAHEFAPQTGQAESLDAVIGLMSRGRKRGFCGLLATQRLSKLHKDCAAEARNLLIGLTNFDVDLRRAADLLGMNKSDWGTLRGLKPGEFFATGPALGVKGVGRIQVIKCKTTHPKAGKRHIEPPKPSAKIKRVLPEFEDLPERAAEEARTLEEAKAEVRKLRRELRTASNGKATVDTKAVGDLHRQIKAVERELATTKRSYRRILQGLHTRAGDAQTQLTATLESATSKGQRSLQALADAADSALSMMGDTTEATPAPERSQAPSRRAPPRASRGTQASMPSGGKRRILIALAQHQDGLEHTQLALYAGMSSRGGTFRTYLGALKTEGLAVGNRLCLTITDQGLEVLGDEWEPLPQGTDLIEYWLAEVGGGKRRILEELIAAGEEGLDREELAGRADMSSSGGTFRTYLGYLRTIKLVERGDPIRASSTLLEAR